MRPWPRRKATPSWRPPDADITLTTVGTVGADSTCVWSVLNSTGVRRMRSRTANRASRFSRVRTWCHPRVRIPTICALAHIGLHFNSCFRRAINAPGIIPRMSMCGRNHVYDSLRGPCAECQYLVFVARSSGFYLFQVPWEWSLSVRRIRLAASLTKHLGRSPDHWTNPRGCEEYRCEFSALLSSHSLPELTEDERYCLVEVVAA